MNLISKLCVPRQEQRKEYQEKCRIQVENKTYLALIAQLRAENEVLCGLFPLLELSIKHELAI